MLRPFFTKQFKKDVKRLEKSGSKDIEKLKLIINTLIEERNLDKKYRDHTLMGYFKDRRECHIEPDWLLVYKLNKEEKIIIFERTGSHPELFE
ncbi:MAG: type II toxin-antitoxin system YafQ family toxin [Proteobacteria bacterium]|nr:type II toxin-antitoxin system YafQ family toxin [Pseudomonadota bacterium]